jgi:BirA family biotin operon repressor/biotin-[acetyl-CoA-carboxylase] ligase
MAEQGAPEGLVVIAERQTSGRGKQGKRWESRVGGLWTSIVLRPSHPSSYAQIFTLVGAVAAAEAIRMMSGLEVLIRWPNDLILAGKKIGGILCEAKVAGRKIRHLVMGIGINVNQAEGDFSLPLRGSATSLRHESGRIWDRRVLAEAIYDRLDFWYRSLQATDLSPLFMRLDELSKGDGSEWSELKQMLGLS